MRSSPQTCSHPHLNHTVSLSNLTFLSEAACVTAKKKKKGIFNAFIRSSGLLQKQDGLFFSSEGQAGMQTENSQSLKQHKVLCVCEALAARGEKSSFCSRWVTLKAWQMYCGWKSARSPGPNVGSYRICKTTVSVVGYVPCWHFNKTCAVMFKLHVYDLTEGCHCRSMLLDIYNATTWVFFFFVREPWEKFPAMFVARKTQIFLTRPWNICSHFCGNQNTIFPEP